VRWAIPVVLLLTAGSSVIGPAAAHSREGAHPALVQDGPARVAERRQHVRRRPASEALANLRTRWPVQGRINSGFGTRGSFWRRHFHTGIDIGAPRGTPVRTPAAGVVTYAGWRSGYGRTVIIDHGGQVRSLYGHLSTLDVRRNQKVGAGTEIGRTGMTGNASGPHLHYEVLVKGNPVNPRSRGEDPAGKFVAEGPGVQQIAQPGRRAIRRPMAPRPDDGQQVARHVTDLEPSKGVRNEPAREHPVIHERGGGEKQQEERKGLRQLSKAMGGGTQ
jgi:murein DD-endopeptidase MepM/ murein hydrolase activator NlpD